MPHRLFGINEFVEEFHTGDKFGYFVDIIEAEDIPDESQGLYIQSLNRPNSFSFLKKEIEILKVGVKFRTRKFHYRLRKF